MQTIDISSVATPTRTHFLKRSTHFSGHPSSPLTERPSRPSVRTRIQRKRQALDRFFLTGKSSNLLAEFTVDDLDTLTDRKVLEKAVKNNDTPLVRQLFEWGMRPNLDDLNAAVVCLDANIKAMFGAYVDAQNLLHDALENGNSTLARKFLAIGADPNKTDDKGQSPFYYAIESGDFKNVVRLLDQGASFELRQPTSYKAQANELYQATRNLEAHPSRDAFKKIYDLILHVSLLHDFNSLDTDGLSNSEDVVLKSLMIDTLLDEYDFDIPTKTSFLRSKKLEQMLSQANPSSNAILKPIFKSIRLLKESQFLWFSTGTVKHRTEFLIQRSGDGQYYDVSIANRGDGIRFHDQDDSERVYPLAFRIQNEGSSRQDFFIALLKAHRLYRGSRLTAQEFYAHFNALANQKGIEKLTRFGRPQVAQKASNCCTMSKLSVISQLFSSTDDKALYSEMKGKIGTALEHRISQLASPLNPTRIIQTAKERLGVVGIIKDIKANQKKQRYERMAALADVAQVKTLNQWETESRHYESVTSLRALAYHELGNRASEKKALTYFNNSIQGYQDLADHHGPNALQGERRKDSVSEERSNLVVAMSKDALATFSETPFLYTIEVDLTTLREARNRCALFVSDTEAQKSEVQGNLQSLINRYKKIIKLQEKAKFHRRSADETEGRKKLDHLNEAALYYGDLSVLDTGNRAHWDARSTNYSGKNHDCAISIISNSLQRMPTADTLNLTAVKLAMCEESLDLAITYLPENHPFRQKSGPALRGIAAACKKLFLTFQTRYPSPQLPKKETSTYPTRRAFRRSRLKQASTVTNGSSLTVSMGRRGKHVSSRRALEKPNVFGVKLAW